MLLRVFKKTNGNGNVSDSYNIVIRRRRAIWTSPEIASTVCLFAPQITLYLGKRDFVDHVDSVEVVGRFYSVPTLKHGSCLWTDAAGLFLLCRGRRQSGAFRPQRQERYVNPKRPKDDDPKDVFHFAVYVYLACAFRYGSEDLDVMGLSFRRDIWIQRVQVYPPTGENPAKTPMHEFLLGKIGEQGYAFSFQVRKHHFFVGLHSFFFVRQSFFPSLIPDADQSALLRLPAARAQRFWQGSLTCPTCVLHTHLDCLTVYCMRLRYTLGLRRGLRGQSLPRQCAPQYRWGHREEVGAPGTRMRKP